MPKLIRRAVRKGGGAALIAALQMVALALAGLLMPWASGPQQQPTKQQQAAPAGSQTSAPVAGGGDAGIAASDTDALQQPAPIAKDLTAADKAALRKTAHFAKKLQEPLASQVCSLQTQRIADHAAQRSSQGPEAPNEEPTLTTDQEDYPPFSYVYFTGTGFQPDETVQMIVAETDPDPQSFEPWEVVADENGNFYTSWYIFSQEFNGATFLATATGETSQLTASCTFTDANGDGTESVSPGSTTPGSQGNSFTFSWRNEGGAFNANSYATIVVPAGWTTPQTASGPGSPGYVNATAVGSATVNSTTVSGNTITVTFNATAGAANGFDLTYGGGGTAVTASSTVGTHTFTTSTHNGSGGTPTAIAQSPSIIVSPTIQQRGSATTADTGGANAATLTINKPTGVATGDVLIASIALRGGDASTYPTSSGWTQIASTTFEGNNNHRTALYYKVAGSLEPASYTFTINPPNASANMAGAIVAFYNVDTVSGPFDVAPGSYSTNTTNTNITGVTSITTVTANAAVLMFAAGNENVQITNFSTATSPGALGELYGDVANGSSSVGAGWSIKATAGSTGAGSGTNTPTSRWGAILIALRPSGCACDPTTGGQGSNQSIECPATPTFTAPTASDTCGGNPTVVEDSDSIVNGTCAGTYTETKTWHAVNSCGNTSGTVTQTITVQDTTPPTIGSPGANNTVECPTVPSFTAPTASDTCSSVTVQDLGETTTQGTCANDYTAAASWRAVDACGNTSGTVTQTIMVEDTTPPTIIEQGADATIECPASPSFTVPEASDACGGTTVVQDSDTTAAGCGNTYTETRSWHAVDACGNTSGTVKQTIMVVDHTPPEISGGGSDETVECPASPTFTAPTSTDTCGSSTVVQDSDTTAAGCGGSYSETMTWHAVDACGNTSISHSQTITVQDHTGPTIGDPGADGTVECPNSPVFTPPTASDTCSGATVVQDSDTTFTGCGGTYEVARTWHAVDACGNISVLRSQTIAVRDTTAPEIGGQGSNATIECPATPTFTAPTASDACGTSTVIEDGDTTAAGTCANDYSRTKTWHAVDACGNTSGTVTQTIMVVDDQPPTIGGQGSNATIECPATPSFTAPTASDTCSGATVQDLGATTAAGTCANNYTSTKSWKAVDACGNTSGTVTQTITVRDTTAPAIGGQGSNATIQCPATPSFTAPTASDACGGSTVQDLGAITTAGTCANNYTSTKSWNAVDACGNTSGTVTQTITVRDTTAPTIGGQGSNATIECPATPTFTAPTASDACGGSTVQDLGATTTAGTCANNYTSTKSWNAVDACGNTSGTVTQTITVRDTTAPTIGSAGADTTIACNGSPMFTPPTASDACGTSTVQQASDDTTTQGTNTIFTRCWNAVDACGNTSGTVCQTITRPACPSPTPSPSATPTPTPTPALTPACQQSTSISSNFNGTPINGGNYIWFSSVLKADHLPSTPVTITFTNQTITSPSFGPLPVPDASVTFVPGPGSATTTFGGGVWMTTVPSSIGGNTFLSGLSFPVPGNLPGGIHPVTWSGTITINTPGVSINWQWAAAVYTNFTSAYNALGVKPVDDNKASQYKNSDHAGTPENFKQFVIGGARGGGGSNYTGSYSGTASVCRQ